MQKIQDEQNINILHKDKTQTGTCMTHPTQS